MSDSKPPHTATEASDETTRIGSINLSPTAAKVVEAAVVEPAQQVAEQIEEINPADAAAALQALSTDKAADVVEYLDFNTAGDILAQMDATQAALVIVEMEIPEAGMVLGAMDPDDRVDILEHIPAPLHDQLVNEMRAEDAAEVRQLEQYPPDTAGGIMTTEVTALYEYLSVDNAIQLLRRLNEELEQMFYVYVIDRRKHLVGVLSMRDLILAKPDKLLRDIMIKNVRSVPATMDQEQVARQMKRYGYLASPVVDAQNRLIGLITLDDVVDVLEEEATEDVQRLFGAGAEERLTSTWSFSFSRRVGWLLVNLGTAFFAGIVVGGFEDTLSQITALAIYMPIVAGTGGNASAQAMAVAVRGISIGDMPSKVLRNVMSRELRVGLLTGITIGTVTGSIAMLWQKDYRLGIVVGLALIVNHIMACTTGAGIPFVMKRLGFDPAQSATIFATTITDVVGFFGLFMLARLIMQ